MNGEDPRATPDLRADPDVPEGIRYDPDLAVHEPMESPAAPLEPGRRHSPLLLFALGLGLLTAVIYALFGLIARETRSSMDYLNEVRIGRGEAWRAAYEMSRMIPDEDPSRRNGALAPQIASLLKESGGRDPRLRRYLVLSLSELRDPRAADPLLAALTDSDVETRIYAAFGLAALGERRASDPLVLLLDDADAGVRKMAAYGLGLVGQPGAVAALRASLNDPQDEVAWNAALALARLGDASGAPLLRRLLDRAYLRERTVPGSDGRPRPLEEAGQEELLLNALRGLALLGDKDHVRLVRQLRENDPNPRVRQAAIEALLALDRQGN